VAGEAYVLDSFAVLALLGNEAGSDDVSWLLREAEKGTARLLMTWVNVGEVAYIVEREWGRERMYRVLAALEATEIVFVPVGRSPALGAAAIKAQHSLAYADALAAGLAVSEEATLVTGDPEFRQLGGMVTIRWLSQER
jgi:predicted nucleic acid-binding protein